MNLNILLAVATVSLLPSSSNAAIGFPKSACSAYGNLIEESENRRVYENKYIHYILTYNAKGLVDSLEVRFQKGQRPSYERMLEVLPKPISKSDLQWKKTTCCEDSGCITLSSNKQSYQAHITKERWNRQAKIIVSKR